jgi:hypothetical protein
MKLAILSNKKYQYIAVLVAMLPLIALGSSKVFSQANDAAPSPFNVSTTPVVTTLDTKPGVPTSTIIKVKNNNTAPERLKARILKFSSNDQDGSPQLFEADANDEFLKWISFSESAFTAEPNVWKEITVTISPANTAAFGYYYAVVFEREGEQPQVGRTTNLSGSVAVPVLLNVSAPGETRRAEIKEFTSERNIYEYLPAKFKVKVNNGGNTHVAPRGNVFITKGGENVAVLDINKNRGNILPGTNREFTSEWNEGSPVYKVKEADGKAVLNDKGEPTYELDWNGFDPSKLRFGKYHAKVAMIYDDGKGDVATEAELDFWVIPWKLIGIGLLALLLIGAGLWATVIRPLRKGMKKLPAKSKKNKSV